MLDVFPMTFLG